MRKLAWFAAAFSAAVFLAVYLLPEELLLPAGALCALGALAGLALRGHCRLRFLLAGFGLAAGLLWSGVYAGIALMPARALAGTEGEARATVADWPQETQRGSAVLVRLHPEEGLDVKTLLYLEDTEPDLRPGDQIRFSAQFRPADTLGGEPDYYYYAKGICLLAYDGVILDRVRPEVPSPWWWPAYVSKAMKDSVARCFPESASGLVSALITGDKSALDPGLYSALRRTGLAHVVAVSGLHVSFLAGVVAALLGTHRRRSAAVIVALLFFFAAVAGNTPSVLRAAFMQTMLLLAPLVDREDDRPTSLATVLMLLLVWDPYAAASVSLQLSFAAVAGIYLFTQPLCDRWQAKLPDKPKGLAARLGCKAAKFVTATLAVSLGAIAFTTPLVAYYFRSVSLIGPLANLLCLWAVSDAFLGGIVTAVAGIFLPGLASLLALPVSLPVWYLQWIAPKLSALPFAAVTTRSIYLKLWLGSVYALLLLYLLWRGERKRPLVPLGLGVSTLCAALVFQAAGVASGGLTVSVLDVGQGLSVALHTQGHTALVDCGGNSLNDPGELAADWFQSLGLSRIDLLVLTHYHQDHASGVPALLERMEVGTLVLPDVEEESPLRREIETLAEEKGIEVLRIAEDARVELGDAQLRIYAPLGSGDTNEEGLSVLCTYGDFDALITGDMGADIEKRLVKYGDLPDTELLVVGHHGSKDATSEELLRAAKPELAAISVGRNSYGHPADETLARLAAAGCEIYRTDWSGTVSFTAPRHTISGG